MPNAEIGYSGTNLVLAMDSPSINKTDAGDEPTFTYHGGKSNYEAAITNLGIAFGDPAPAPYAAAKLRSVNIRSNGPNKVLIDYVYKLDNTGNGEILPSVGTVIRSGDANPIEIPIGQHPNANPGVNYDPVQKIGIGVWEGIQSFLQPQPVYNRREILNSFTWDEASLIANVSNRFSAVQMAAKGLASATDNKWLQMVFRITENGSKYDQEESFQYAKEGWRTDIYDAAT